ncbi:MAG: hypothetical protein KF861_04975 [Planctomycetaceae bacterium]|nr:hypothetical protein [Planctomycetaceae bacterium]
MSSSTAIRILAISFAMGAVLGFRAAPALLAQETAVAPSSALPVVVDIPWEMRPYRVLVSLATDGSPALTADFRSQITALLRARTDGVLGDYWQTEFESNQWLLPSHGDALQRVVASDVAARFDAQEFDKVLIVTLATGPPLRFSGREWDRSTGELGPVIFRDVDDRRRAGAAAFDLLLEMFRPLSRVDRSEDGIAELRVRGGELLAPESSQVLFQPDDLLVPYFRYLNREQEVRSVQVVPWTYLRVDEINRSRMTATIDTAFAAPLSGSRRRVELVALRARPTFEETKLRLAPRNNPSLPLVGVRVKVYEPYALAEHPPAAAAADLMTDRFGRVTIAASPGDPLCRLVVHSGGAVLANVPFLPGLVREISLELPDDTPRLGAEGNLAIVEGELIDVVTRRTIMLARALALARNGDYAQADQLMAEIDRQPSTASFKSKILAIRVPAADLAQKNRDRAAEKRILAMCRELEELVDRYLDRAAVRDVAAEINELRKFSEKAPPRGST